MEYNKKLETMMERGDKIEWGHGSYGAGFVFLFGESKSHIWAVNDWDVQLRLGASVW